ncbi:hypothetical protein [Mesorhizobium sp. BR-1-1-10]|uniref:hypothetical protein n=1 Tax=Mesorhizobium sp. BR-1-1-10 TaxID=2876660 RepID=UPI001CD0F588|nr:hypothetical protein [Mesorhizobium sp. BR-1-1-10]MBZ9974630.1 hypothetical protein [Mesorhizobium sp. BR-1-1-10]
MSDETSVKLIKILWRLDYDLSYAVYDRRGACVRTLLETIPDFLTKVGEARAQNRVTGETEEGAPAINISIDPNSISGAIEWPLGTALKGVLQHPAFRNVNKVASELMAIAEVAKVKRFGIRFIVLIKSAKLPRRYGSVDHMFDEGASRSIRDILGNIEDAAVVVEGKAEDSVNYRVSYGPFAQKNIDLHLAKSKDDIDPDYYSGYNAVVDLDLFELDFFLLEKSLFRWSSTKVDKVEKFVQSVVGGGGR